MRSTWLCALVMASLLLASCEKPSEVFKAESEFTSSSEGACIIRNLKAGPVWSAQEVKGVKLSGFHLGMKVSEFDQAGKDLRLLNSSEQIQEFSLPRGETGKGMIPWLEFAVMSEGSADHVTAADDLSFVWDHINDVEDPRNPVPTAVWGGSPSNKGGVVSSVRIPLTPVNSEDIFARMKNAFGEPTASFTTSGSCGEANYVLYGSEEVSSSGWFFDHYYRCVAAGGPGNMPEFECDIDVAPRAPWFGLKSIGDSTVLSMQDGELGFQNRYAEGYKASVFPMEW